LFLTIAFLKAAFFSFLVAPRPNQTKILQEAVSRIKASYTQIQVGT